MRTVKCEVCGKVFETEHPNKKYCSLECGHKANRKNMVDRLHKLTDAGLCIQCGKRKATVGRMCKECRERRHAVQSNVQCSEFECIRDGSSRCCFYCKYKRSCPDPCDNDPKKCGYGFVQTDEESEEIENITESNMR